MEILRNTIHRQDKSCRRFEPGI